MKQRVSLFLLVCCTITLHAQNNPEATAYYEMIKNEQANIGKELYYFRQRVTDLNLKILDFQIRKSIAIVDSTPPYNNEMKYKTATVNLFKYFLGVCQNQYKQLLKYVEDPNMENKDYNTKVGALFKDISTHEKPYDQAYDEAEDAYMQKYGIKPE